LGGGGGGGGVVGGGGTLFAFVLYKGGDGHLLVGGGGNVILRGALTCCLDRGVRELRRGGDHCWIEVSLDGGTVLFLPCWY